jgi:(p)ppGpp synthase/HD superfamily hydrolase
MFDTEITLASYAIANEAHAGDTRKFQDIPYAMHPVCVAREVYRLVPGNHAAVAAALLHDTVEDTDVTEDDIDQAVGREIADLVLELTNDVSEIKRKGKAQYLADKMVSMSDDALTIKLADRLDNTKDLHLAPIRFARRYASQTKNIIGQVRSRRRSTTHYHRDLMKKIDDSIRAYV